MNYGVLVLGATISISLFLRICGGTIADTQSFIPQETRTDIFEGAKYDDTLYGWITNNKYYVVEQFLRKLWSQNLRGIHGSDRIRRQVDRFIAEVRPYPGNVNRMQDTMPILPLPIENDDEDYGDVCQMDWKINERESQPRVITQPDSLEVNQFNLAGCTYDDTEKRLYCGDKTLSAMPELPRQTDLIEFHLVSTNVNDVPSSTFGNRNMSIQNIVLKNNRLKHIDPGTFAGIKNLTNLMIINNELDFISREFFAGLTETIFISLADNKISFRKFENCSERDDSDIPPMLQALKHFRLDGNPLEIIPNQMFAGLRNSLVNTLSLVNCKLTRIFPRTLAYLPLLDNLNLSENPKLDLLEAFQGLRHGILKTLDLSTNNLGEINKAALEIVAPTLTTLNLENNHLGSIAVDSFPDNMPRMEELNLKNCYIEYIENGAFDGLQYLNSLVLDNNKLGEVPPTVSNLRRLRLLSFTGNNNKVGHFSIERGVFTQLTGLMNLYMNGLNLNYIQLDAFSGLSNVMYLLLDNVNVETVEDFAFSHMKKLKFMSMEGSFSKPRAEFNSLTFYGLDNLETLYLARNNISFFNPNKVPISDLPVYSQGPDSFRQNKTEEMLRETRDFASPFKYLPNLNYLRLSENRIEDLYPELFYGANKLKNVTLDRNTIQTWQRPLFPNGTTILELKLEKNSIGPITEEMMDDFMEVKEVDLSDNSFLCKIGSCQMKDLVESNNITLVNWDIYASYQCVDLSTNMYYDIKRLPEEVCKLSDEKVPPPSEQGPNEEDTDGEGSNNIIITIGIVCFCGIFVMTAIVTGYRKRVHLKYFWFVVKFNVMKLPEKTLMTVSEVISYNYDIFISYHHEDAKFVKEFFLPEIESGPGSSHNQDIYDEKVSKPEVKVCFHERDFEVGVPITENILDCVDRSKKVVVLVSKKYLESQWCVFEMKLAYHRLIEARRKSFLIVLMEDIPNELKTKVLNYLMKSRTYLEWPGINSSPVEQRNFWNRLRSSIKSPD